MVDEDDNGCRLLFAMTAARMTLAGESEGGRDAAVDEGILAGS